MARKPAASGRRAKKVGTARKKKADGTKSREVKGIVRKKSLRKPQGNSARIQQDKARVDACMRVFEKNENSLKIFLEQVALVIMGSPVLSKEMHTVKTRLKSRTSLRDKLSRKFAQERRDHADLDIRPQNLFEKINDVVGIR